MEEKEEGEDNDTERDAEEGRGRVGGNRDRNWEIAVK